MKRLLTLLPLILLAFLLASCGSPAEPYYSEGNARYENGEYEEAIADFTEATRLDPNHTESHYGRGLAHYALGKYEEAIDDYTEAIRLDPELADAYGNRGGAYLELGEYEEAIDDCTEAIRLDPNLAIAYSNRAAAYLDLGKYDEAISDCSEAIRLDPNLAAPYNNRAAAHSELGEYDQVIDDCTEAIRLDPDLTLAYCNRAVAHYELGEYEETIDDCTKALRLDPERTLAYNTRGAAHNALGEYEEAIDDCGEAIRLDPSLAMAYSNRGVAHYELGNYEETIDDCTEAIRLDPDDAEAYFYRCRARGQLGESEEAIDDCTEAIRLEPEHADAYTSRGVVHGFMGDYEQAMADYDEAIRLDANLARAYYNRGVLHGDLGEFEKAVEDLTEAIRLDADDAWAYYYRGLAHFTMGEHEEAAKDYSEAIDIDPEFAEAYRWRGLAHYELGEYEEATADRAEAIRLDANYATDLSDVVLTSRDLGNGFVDVALSELGLTVEDLSQEGFAVESVSTLVQAEPFEMVMGFTTLVTSELEQASFDLALRNPDFLLESFVVGMGATEILEQKELVGLDDIGDASAGLTVAADMQGFPLRIDLVVSRRGIVGAFALVMYLDGEEPTLTVGHVARKLDDRIEILVPSTPSTTTPLPEVGSAERPVQLMFAPTVDVAVIESAGDKMSNWITDQTGIHFEVSVRVSYAATIEAMCAAEGDAMAFIPGMGYVLAHDKCDVEVALAMIRYGRTAYWTEFVVRRDSGITSLQDLEGKKWAVPSFASTSGYLWPSVLLSLNGITPGEVVEAGSHPQAVLAVMNGTADFGTCYFSPPGDTVEDWSEGDPLEPDGDFEIEQQDDGSYKVWKGRLRIRDARVAAMNFDPDVMDEIGLLAISERLPNDTVSFVSDFPGELRETIVQALIDYAATEEGAEVLDFEDFLHITGFSRVDDQYYDPVRNAINILGWTEEDILE